MARQASWTAEIAARRREESGIGDERRQSGARLRILAEERRRRHERSRIRGLCPFGAAQFGLSGSRRRGIVLLVDPEKRHILRTEGAIGPRERGLLLGQRGCVVWLTGLSGSGKSTIAHLVEEELFRRGRLAFVLDGDNLRHGLCADLGFSAKDRAENIRRAGAVAALLADAGAIVLASFISPYAADRARAREAVGAERFAEVHVDAPLSTCEQRDPKGLYRKARGGEIQSFTGIDAPYEPPAAPDLALRTAEEDPIASAMRVVDLLAGRGFLLPPGEEDPR
ncbi:MAG: hypothetical protein Fur0037_02870 [Planctomycetota bacterium]